MRLYALALALLLAGNAVHAEIEKPAATNGAGYAIIPQLFDGSTGSTSYIRLINANNGATNFTVLVINTTNGVTLGSAVITVPSYAAPQYPLTGANSILSLTGVAPSAAANAALYIQDTDVGAGYAHVTFNGTTNLFENQSTCTTPLNQRLTSQSRQMLANVHTTALASNRYPSVIGIHNYATSAATVRLTAYDAATGTYVGQVNQTVAANGTLSLSESQFESLIGFTPTSAQLHINIVVSNAVLTSAPTVTLTQTIRNVQLGGEVNMGQVCAVNAVSATTTTPVPTSTAPSAYCGTVTFPAGFPAPLPTTPMQIVMSVAGNGWVKGTLYGVANGAVIGDYLWGYIQEKTLTLNLSDSDLRGSGQLVGTSIFISFETQYGVFSFITSQTACNT